jgi:outer membrane protein OmpA-like peptidoglycan-associated protein
MRTTGAGHRRGVVVLIAAGAFAAACSTRPDQSQQAEKPQPITAASASSPAAAATPSSDSNALGALVGAPDSDSSPPEPWALESPPDDWHTHASIDIPVLPGLTEVVAVQEPQGDYESVGTIESVSAQVVSYLFSVRSGSLNGVTSNRARRTVARRDMDDAHAYRMTFSSADPETFPGQTAVGISSAVFRELQDHGRSRINLYASTGVAAALATILSAVGAESSDLKGELSRVESEFIGVPVLVNGRRIWLRTVHAKGDFTRIDGVVPAEFWFLADARNPMTLRAAVDHTRLQVVRIDFPAEETASALEHALANREPFEMWGVYFEFASAQLQPESNTVLDQVAAVLQRHPDWRLRIEGHTDDVGNESGNLRLSRERAEAVRAALVQRLGHDGGQLEATGYGKSQPRESNATLSGRARNRRVELTRQ